MKKHIELVFARHSTITVSTAKAAESKLWAACRSLSGMRSITRSMHYCVAYGDSDLGAYRHPDFNVDEFIARYAEPHSALWIIQKRQRLQDLKHMSEYIAMHSHPLKRQLKADIAQERKYWTATSHKEVTQ